MRKLLLAVTVLAMVLVTVRGAVAPPPEFFSIAPAGYSVDGSVGAASQVSASPVEQQSVMNDGTDGVESGMSVVLMLLSLLVVVLIGSAAVIYRLKVRL